MSRDIKFTILFRSLTSSSGLITPGFSKQNTQSSFGRSPAIIQGKFFNVLKKFRMKYEFQVF